MTVGFRPNEADAHLIEKHKHEGESTTDVLRRALRALDEVEWRRQAREEMQRLAAGGEDLSEEPDEWGYDEQGNPVDLRSEGPGPKQAAA